VANKGDDSGLESALPPTEFPPAEYMRLVGGDVPNLRENFDDVGRELAGQLGRLGMLGPKARLLDIGCGCGRVARHLLGSPIAAYAGFDRHPGMIEWAQSHIGARDGRFRFQHVDVQSGYTELDGQRGTIPAAEFVFPYDDAAFTGGLAASVFTHIDFSTTGHYLRETARVLVPNGCVLASFFRGQETGSLGRSSRNFVIEEDDLLRAIEEAGLEVALLDPAPPRPPSRQSWFVIRKPET
jgi:SAM-dependent methyltransferase